MSTTQKKQHYVWRYHLEAWAVGGAVHWYSIERRKGGHGSPASLAYGKYFYKTERLSDVDKRYMENFIEKLPVAGMREALTRQIQLFQAPHALRELLEKSAVLPPDHIMKMISEETEIFDKTIGENWHGGIEARAIPLLDMLRNRNATFWDDPSQSSFFIWFLCHQFFRTPKMKQVYDNAHKTVAIPGLNMNRLWVIETIMFATILGANLFIERKKYKLDFLNNRSGVQFITSDQPIINLNDSNDSNVCLYYPISPALAVRLSTNENIANNSNSSVSSLAAEFYNHSIFRACWDQLYGSDGNYLTSLAQLPRELKS